jgi:ADP-ribose pyrophosphatase YjhB (NUDIX family)
MAPLKDSHCSYCGAPFAPDAGWPRTCAACRQVSYKNPVPVAVLIVPADGGVVAIRRAVAPGVGKLALPGGFINHGESWQAAAVRELGEETPLRVDAAAVRLFAVRSAPDGTLLVFGVVPPVGALPAFTATDETSELVVLAVATELAFPLHTEALRDYFAAPC